MAKRKFKIGDKVVVTGVPCMRFVPGIRDELGSRSLFRSMVGRVYTVRGFDKYGHIELKPTRLDWVWIEPELLKLRAKKKTPRSADHINEFHLTVRILINL